MKDIVFKPMPHSGLWIYYRLNRANLANILEKNKFDSKLVGLANFLENVWSQKGFVPHWLFDNNKSKRVTSFSEGKNAFDEELLKMSEVSVSRFKDFTNEGMEEYEKRKASGKKMSRHNCVLIPILKEDENSLAIEVPLWALKFYFSNTDEWLPVTGHVDLLQVLDGKAFIWDYKPDDSPIVWEQVLNYRKVLCSMLPNLSLENVRCGWFNNTHEYVLKV